MKEMIATLYGYARWANERVLANADALSPDQLARKLTRGADSILETFGHLVSADVRWLARWRGEAAPAISKTDFQTLDEVRKRWDALYLARGVYIASLDEEELREPITWTGRERPVPIPRWQAMVHCANHGTQHRSEIAAMLTDLGHSPGDLDMVLYCVDHPRGS
jgi:uncharacterized damage-inducible protein DinB